MLRSGVRPASRANRVLNYVLSCVLANSKMSLLRLRQTCEKSFSPPCVPRPATTVSSTMSSACPREFEDESAEAKANLRKILPSGPRPASRAHHVLNCVLSCVLAVSSLCAAALPCCAPPTPNLLITRSVVL